MPEKCEGALICQVELIKRLNVGKPENKLWLKGWSSYIIVYNMQATLDPVSRFCGAPVEDTERTIACYEVSTQ